MADLAQLEKALVNADAAGDVEAATAIAGEIKRIRPQRSMGEDLGRQVGLTARAAVKGAAGIPNMIGDALAGLTGNPGLFSQKLDSLLSRFLPTPETATERVAGDVAGALTATGALAKGAQLAAPTGPIAQKLAEALYGNMGAQTASTIASSGAAGITRESGGGPLAQVAAGLAAGVGVPMGMQAMANLASPQARLAASIQKSEKTPFAAEGERLARETGIELTPGAQTGNRFMTSMENTARRYAPTADRVQDIDVKIANQAINRVNSLADRISKSTADPEQLGDSIRSTVQSAAQKLDKMRSTTASNDYGLVRELADGQKVVRFQGFSDELKSIIDDYANVAGTDAQKVVSQASAALKRITGTIEKGVPDRVLETPTGRPIKLSGTPAVTGTIDNTIDEAIRTRSFYGQAARGSANVFEDIAPDLQRRLAARLFGAINRDIDNAAEGVDGPLKQALSVANANYRKASQSIEFLEKSALGKLVGDDIVDAALSGQKMNTASGEQFMQRIATMHPSVRRNSMEIIDRWNPELAKDLRANVLRSALDQGAAIPPSVKGSSQIPISFNRFLSALGSEKVGFQKNLESYGFTPKEIAEIRDVASAMLRQGDRTGTNFSNTEVMRQNMEISEAMGDAAMAATTGGFSGLLRNAAGKTMTIAGKRIGMNKVVDAMASAEGRKALKTVSSPQASPQAVIAAFSVIESEKE